MRNQYRVFSMLCLFALTLLTFPDAFGQAPAAKSVALNKFTVEQDVEWVKVGGVSLTMDIYTPQTGKKKYPVFVIFHGGGWLINNESIMDEMSRYIVEHGDYVVCNVNYRLLPMNGNTITMDQIIQDAMGAVLWIKENISKYNGDRDKICLSGDSAGGHLAAMVANAGDQLTSKGFDGSSFSFRPTYMPRGKTPESIAAAQGLAVQAVVLNYPATDIYAACAGPSGDGTNGFEQPSNGFWQFAQATPRGLFGDAVNVVEHPDYYKMVSPIHTIPSKRKLPPHFCAVGSNDDLTTPQQVKTYVDALKSAGHPAEYWEHTDRPHAYLDSGSNLFLGTSFPKDAPPAIDKILLFLNRTFKQ